MTEWFAGSCSPGRYGWGTPTPNPVVPIEMFTVDPSGVTAPPGGS